MRIFNSLRAKLLVFILGAFILVIITLLSITILSLTTYFESGSKQQLEDNILSFEALLTNYEDQAIAHAETVALNASVIEEVEKKDFEALLNLSTPLMEKGKLDYMVFTDTEGTVIIRIHEPDKIPAADDNISKQVNVTQAMQGKSFVGIEQGKVVKLSVRAGAPIHNSAGKLIGVVSTGYTISQNSIVDFSKKLIGSDFSIFFDDLPVATTLTDSSGNRLVDNFSGTNSLLSALNDQDVLIKKNNIADKEYLSAYFSIIGADNNPICVVSSSIATATQDALKASIINKILIPSFFVIILVFILGFYLSNKISNIVVSLQKNLFQAGRGDLTVQCSIDSTDEIGILKSSFNSMVDHQTEMISYIKESSAGLSLSSHNLASTSNQVTSAVNDIAESIQNVSTQSNDGQQAIQKVSNVLTDFSSLIENAKSLTESTQENSKTALQAAELGKEVIEEAKRRISIIDLKTQETEKLISVLKEYSEKIAIISDTINTLALQTNLLSLNASIEAARAGEAGRGFSVVADEVRKLAEQSTTGASEVATLIQKILESTNAAVSCTYESKKEAETGVKTILQAEEAFDRILFAVDETSQDVGHIVTITKEESKYTDDIIQSMNSVIKIMEAMAQNAHEVAAATEEISASMDEVNKNTLDTNQMAETLQNKVQEFTLRSNSDFTDAEMLEKVKTDHYLFVIMILNMLKGIVKIDANNIATHITCRFGKWYYDPANQYKNTKIFKSLEKPHRLLHEYAHTAVKAYHDGDIKSAKKAYYNVEKYSHRIVGMISQLSKTKL